MICTLFTALFLILVTAAQAADEPYPTRPITIVVPFPPGGIADLTARPFAPALERVLKQPVVVAQQVRCRRSRRHAVRRHCET